MQRGYLVCVRVFVEVVQARKSLQKNLNWKELNFITLV